MKFGPVPVADALGSVLAHSIVLSGKKLKKGHILTSENIQQLAVSGSQEVTVAVLEASDVMEDVAAQRLAVVLAGEHFYATEAFTGRVNLHAKVPGILSAQSKTVDKINRICPAITMATLADGSFVEAGRMVATVKIIPFAVNQDHLLQAESLAKSECTIGLSPSAPQRVGLIATQLPFLKSSVMDKTAKILEKRIAIAGSTLAWEDRIPHTERAVAEALQHRDAADLIVIFGASAITDPDDVLPKGAALAGAEVIRVGMPVDPGNLLMIAQLGQVPVIGAPGCARSPAENGFDWVLQRLLAGLEVDTNYITGLGVGGLLMEITDRPQPREPQPLDG